MNYFHLPYIRIRILLIFFLFICIVFSVRIFYLASVPVETYTFVDNTKNITVKRGDVVDCNNKILAVNDELYSIYANPELLKPSEIETISAQLAAILSLNRKSLKEKLSSKKSFIWLKRQVSVQEHTQIKKAAIKGIYATKEYKRIYPNKTLASHILGFCNIDNDGIEGIEKSMNQYLKYDNENDFNDKSQISNGYNIQLTIDSNIQAMAEKALKKHAKDVNAESGCLILLDGKTGEVTALASYPDYDPNHYSKYPQTAFRNNAIFYQYEPGSVFKIFTMAAMIANGGVSIDTIYHCNGAYSNGNQIVKCTGRHNSIDLGGLFKTSCNVAPLQAAETIQKDDLYYYLKKFGFGESTDVELPGEQMGLIRKPANWTSSSMLSVPMGQELSSNALQVVQAATTFINDGVMMRTHLIKHIYDNNGKIIKKNQPKGIRRVIPKGLSTEILEAMGKSTAPDGSVRRLKVDGIRFASKSGTAQMFDQTTQKYSNVEVSSSVLAIFPLEAPRYIVYTVLHKPKAKINWGGVICSYLLNDFISSFTGYLPIFPSEYEVNSRNLLEQMENSAYERIRTFPFSMPDLYGMSAGDACDIFSELNLKIRCYGNGQIRKQQPPPGEIVNAETVVQLYSETEPF